MRNRKMSHFYLDQKFEEGNMGFQTHESHVKLNFVLQLERLYMIMLVL